MTRPARPGTGTPASPRPHQQHPVAPLSAHTRGKARMIQPLNATCEQRSQTERRSGRLVGIDIARGVAILGMLITHVTEGSDVAGAFEVFAGRSMALFALLAGVSLALLSGGSQPVRGLALRQAMVRIAVRAALVFVVGLSLVPLS